MEGVTERNDQLMGEATYRFAATEVRTVVFHGLLVARDGADIAILDLDGLLPSSAAAALAIREFPVAPDRELVPLPGGPSLARSGWAIPPVTATRIACLLRLLSLSKFSGQQFAIVYADGSTEQASFVLTAGEAISAEQPNLLQSTAGFRVSDYRQQLDGIVRIFRGPVIAMIDDEWVLEFDG